MKDSFETIKFSNYSTNCTMLQFKIRQAIESNGSLTPYTWLRKYCNMSTRKAHLVSTHKQASISLTDLSNLCEMLKCTPNDLLYWEQTPSSTLPGSHPCISQLTPPPAITNLNDIMKRIPKNLKEEAMTYLRSKMKE